LVAPAANDVAVLYRDKNPRDMHLARSTDGGKTWTSADAGTFNWQFQGCPEVGAGLCGVKVENGFSYRSLVWTGEAANRGLYLVSSVAPEAPVKVGPPSASRPDMAGDAAGHLTAVYSAMVGEQFSVYGCKSNDGGKSWSEPVQLSEKEAFANYPRVVPLKKGFVALWTESRDGGDAVWRWKTF
jgi:Neuraminidase (sialidase)